MLTLVPEEIEAYAQDHSTAVPPLLAELTQATQEKFGGLAMMLSGQVEGLLLQTLVASIGAKRALEVGTFTGFSALMMAAALPDDGEIVTLEISAEHAAFARSFFERSPDGHKVRLIEGPALDSLQTLEGPFDLVFIDADKAGYVDYYEAALSMLSERGVIAVDNVLWSGYVLDPKEDDGRAIAAFNDHVARDERVSHVLLTIRDGIMLIRRK
ncbi:MAG: class I SAM-dependent methyltransferase [Chloroflexi bacterium]|nr:class I SAM-dependent methyltransferase [Chloroflexota bacterium]MCH8051871.1 class I SAM-dependent methyltransferase [Chloroflexota bacterium]